MPALYLLFSHELTERQQKEAYQELGVVKIHYLPEKLQEIWSQIPPELPDVTGHIEPIKQWLANRIKAGDYILIQGDFGATYQMVKWALARQCIPIYATTARKVKEIWENDKVMTKKVFEHVRFRRYENNNHDKR